MRIRILALVLIAALLAPFSGMAELDLSAPTPEPQSYGIAELSGEALLETPPMTLNCAAALLLEPESGQVIFELNADSPRPVASVTKVMTILLTLEAIDAGRISLDDRITVSADAAGMGGSQVLLDVGETQSIAVLLKSMIVGSANDAAVALAEVLYGSEELCAAQMNERAAELGMTGTHFVNCTGLPADGQHTTARDVAIMSMAMFSHPLYYDFSEIWLDNVDHGDGRVTQLTNTNKLIRLYDGCDGLVRIADVAPELPGAAEFVKAASALCTVSVAHTDSDYDHAKAAFDAGATHLTHLYNAMPGIHHRKPGVIPAAVENKNVRAEIICDGLHIHPASVRLAFSMFGGERMIIVSDSGRCAGQPDGTRFDIGGQFATVIDGVAKLDDGTIACSASNMWACVTNCISWNIPEEDVIRAATYNPACALGVQDEVGSIEPGKVADFIVVDSQYGNRRVFLAGKEM